MLIYQKSGYKIISTRYKSKYGEIDIIAAKESGVIFKKMTSLAFVEVKFRQSEELIENILRKNQIIRIKNTAEIFLSENSEFNDCDISFDFALQIKNKIKIYKNYF